MQPDEIFDLRHALDLTQEELADRLGVSRVAVTAWEAGRNKPSGPAKKLLEQLKAKVDRRNPAQS